MDTLGRHLNLTSSETLSTSYEKIYERETAAKQAASILFGCYRTGDANDPEVYITAVISLLSRYPVEIIRKVTDPASGLPSETKWLPTLAEIREACDKALKPLADAADREARVKRQLLERQETAERPRRLSVDELKEKYGDWGDNWRKPGTKVSEEREAARTTLIDQIGRAAFDSLPDAP